MGEVWFGNLGLWFRFWGEFKGVGGNLKVGGGLLIGPPPVVGFYGALFANASHLHVSRSRPC